MLLRIHALVTFVRFPAVVLAYGAFMDAQILAVGLGPLTSAIETMATSVGAGILLGGFLAGTLGSALAWESNRIDRRAVRAGYYGGVAAVAAAAVDVVLR